MPPVSRYPRASWKGDGVSAGPYLGGPWKVVLHTTETAGMPGYVGGKNAPHLTYDTRDRTFTQHTSLLTSARSLKNDPGGVTTNHDQAIQLEIICYSDESVAAQAWYRLGVSDLSPDHLEDIHQFLLWCHVEFGVEMKWRGKQAYSYAEANAPGFRFTQQEWDDWDGICAHHDVPEGNKHWDTGALNWDAVIYGTEGGNVITNGLAAAYAQLWLIELGYDLGSYTPHAPDPVTGQVFPPGADGAPGTKTKNAVLAFQARLEISETGLLDPTTVTLLKPAGQGPKGDPGVAGTPGPIGLTGDTGPQGEPGVGLEPGTTLTQEVTVL